MLYSPDCEGSNSQFYFRHTSTVKVAVAYFIPDTPKWVELELAKIAYQSRLALQKEVSFYHLIGINS